MIYFMREGDDGPIKVARAKDPHARLMKLQPGHSTQLHVIARFPGGLHREKLIHRELAAYAQGAKWYSPAAADAVAACIARLRNPKYEVQLRPKRTFAVLRRDTEDSPTDPCPFCGSPHWHGETDGHRVADCNVKSSGFLAEITVRDGTVLRQSDGYIVRTRPAA